MDEISTGLDSSTIFQIVNSLKQFTHILKGTTLIYLIQPALETYNLFDDNILISDGQIVYQGPREHVIGFLESMGFKCLKKKGVVDFLGFEHMDFVFSDRWKVESVPIVAWFSGCALFLFFGPSPLAFWLFYEAGTKYEGVDLSSGDFAEYDEKGECLVMISNLCSIFDVVK
ncbi:hypothetical protein QYF36_010403 [Acer negundo]|nr:hypothetical protein QYF36_010403 [Acer negundo]